MSAFIAHYLLGDRLLQEGLQIDKKSIFLLGLQGPDIIKMGMLQSENPEKYQKLYDTVKDFIRSLDKELYMINEPTDFDKGLICYNMLEDELESFTDYAVESLSELDDSISDDEYLNRVESAYDIILLRYEKTITPNKLKPDDMLPQSELAAITAAQYYSSLYCTITEEQVDQNKLAEVILSGVRLAQRLTDKTTLRQIFVRRKEKKYKAGHVQSSMYRGMTEDNDHDYSNFCNAIWLDNGKERTDSLFDLYDTAVHNASAALIKL